MQSWFASFFSLTQKAASVTTWLYIVAMVTLVPVSVQGFSVVQLPSCGILLTVYVTPFGEELDNSKATLLLMLNFSSHIPHQDYRACLPDRYALNQFQRGPVIHNLKSSS